MLIKISIAIASGLVVMAATSVSAADAKAAKVTYADQVSPIFRARCGSCHNADKQKGGLSLETFSTTMQGGGSGKVIEPGDPDSSTLLSLISHKEEPKMPPNSPKLPDGEIAMIRLWIEGGALEASESVAAIKAKPKFEFKLDPASMGKPVGPPAVPENLLTEPAVVSKRPTAVVAMASSPWAPLVAIGGFKQVLIYNTTNQHLSAVLPFPEGTIHVLKFSRSGALLLAGGGRGGQSGLAVVFDVKTGKRVFEIGKEKEYDVVLAADISPDHGQVALGGPGKVVRVYNTADGQLQFEMKKHTEWVTALEFSPDGVLLATGDRNNGLIVWEAQTGREFFDLRGHTGAITDISWRLDSNVVASSSEDGSVKLWEMENGNPIKSWGAHGGGVASVRFAKDGRLITTGRDRVPRLWDQNGGKQRDFEAFGDLALEGVFSHDDSRAITGDWSGEVRIFEVKDGKRLANLAANPAPIASRLELARKAMVETSAAADAALKSLAPLQATAAEKAAAKVKATETHTHAVNQAGLAKASGDNIEKAYRSKIAEEAAALIALKSAQDIVVKAGTDRLTAEKSIPLKISAEKVAAETLATSKAAVEATLSKKTEQDKAFAAAAMTLKAAISKQSAEQGAAELARQAMHSTELTSAVGLSGARQAQAQAAWELAGLEKAGAPKVLESATLQVKVSEDARKAAEAKTVALAAEKAVVAKALADTRATQQAAELVLAARKSELVQAEAALAAAEKALIERKPAVDAAIAVATAAKVEAEALAVEKQRFEASKSPLATNVSKGS